MHKFLTVLYFNRSLTLICQKQNQFFSWALWKGLWPRRKRSYITEPGDWAESFDWPNTHCEQSEQGFVRGNIEKLKFSLKVKVICFLVWFNRLHPTAAGNNMLLFFLAAGYIALWVFNLICQYGRVISQTAVSLSGSQCILFLLKPISTWPDHSCCGHRASVLYI